MVGRAIEIAVAAKHQTRPRILAIGTCKGNQRGERAVGRHLEHSPTPIAACAEGGDAVKTAVRPLHQRSHGICLANEIMQDDIAPKHLCRDSRWESADK